MTGSMTNYDIGDIVIAEAHRHEQIAPLCEDAQIGDVHVRTAAALHTAAQIVYGTCGDVQTSIDAYLRQIRARSAS